MIDGLWIISSEAANGMNGGVAVLINGKIFGGDSGFTWVGAYTRHENILKAHLKISNFDPNIKSIFGYINDYEMHFSGQLEDDVLIGTAVVANQPQHSIPLRLTKKAEL